MRTTMLSLLLIVAAANAFAPSPLLKSMRIRHVPKSSEDDEVFISLEVEEETVADQEKNTKVAISEKEERDDEFKRIRVLVYMGISLLPILALAPFMASRDFLPVDPTTIS